MVTSFCDACLTIRLAQFLQVSPVTMPFSAMAAVTMHWFREDWVRPCHQVNVAATAVAVKTEANEQTTTFFSVRFMRFSYLNTTTHAGTMGRSPAWATSDRRF